MMQSCSQALRQCGSSEDCVIRSFLNPLLQEVVGTDELIAAVEHLCRSSDDFQWAQPLQRADLCCTPMMASFLTKFDAVLSDILPTMSSPKHVIWCGACDEPLRPGCSTQGVVDFLRRAALAPIRIQDRLARMIEKDGVGTLYELGPGQNTSKNLIASGGMAAVRTACRSVGVT